MLYWVTYYGHLTNPLLRPPDDKIPWVPFEYQADYLVYLQDAWRRCTNPLTDESEVIMVPKCRETAGSWSSLALVAWAWNFHNGSGLILSRKEEEVDIPDNPDTPFWKIRELLKHQPEWMLPKGFDWKEHSHTARLANPNGGHIGGDSMSGGAGAGGRVQIIIFDEMAKVKDGKDYQSWTSLYFTARLKIGISTPEGNTNKFSRLCENLDNEQATVFPFAWWKDPRKLRGYYRQPGGKLSSQWNDEAKKTDAETYASQVSISFSGSVKGAIYGNIYDGVHQARNLIPDMAHPVIRSHDPGPHWYTVNAQLLPCGCLLYYQEIYCEMKPIEYISEQFLLVSSTGTFASCHDWRDIGDPAGASVRNSLGNAKSEFTWLRENKSLEVEYGFMFRIPRNEWDDRGELAIKSKMQAWCSEHKRSKFQIDFERCPIMHRGLSGEYKMKTDHSGTPGEQREERHPICDAMDALKYVPLSAGVYTGKENLGRQAPPRSTSQWRPPSQHRRTS